MKVVWGDSTAVQVLTCKRWLNGPNGLRVGFDYLVDNKLKGILLPFMHLERRKR